MLNWRKFFIQVTILSGAVIGALLFFMPSASADGPPPPEEPVVSDPFFREEAPAPDPYFREEAPERMVECEDNVFVPLGEGGTWECPPPEGVAFVETPLEEAEPVATAVERPRFTPEELLMFGGASAGLILVAAGTLYMIYRD